MPYSGKTIKFLDETLELHRVEKEIKDNQIAFKVNPRLTKPEISQYLEKVYGVKITDFKSFNRVGKKKFDQEKRS